MTKDILGIYPMHETTFTLGLFKSIPFEDRTITYFESHKGAHTRFSEALDVMLDDKWSLYDMFHGLCLLYASYFISENPEWTPMVLKNKSTGRLTHVFLTKELNGATLFADARGITDNPLEFFDDYKFSKKTLYVERTDKLPELDFDDMLKYKKAYDIIYNT